MAEYNPTNDDITYFAKTNFRNREQVFGIRRDDRRRHMYVIGKTGVGKSTLLENLATNDITNGEGLAYFDPHGESVEKLLNFIPNDRVNDVVYINPHDTEYPIGFNVLEIKDASQKHLIASGLMAVFKKLWAGVWSARMEYILNNTVLALLDTPGQTLLGIPRMYTDKKFRSKIVANIKDPVVRNFWEGEYANYTEKLRVEAISPIQNKVGQFLSSSIIRNIVAQTKSTIDFREIMDQGKILLVNLSKGRIGEDSSALLGAMMITKLQLSAMSRVDIPESERRDFYLYVDEFQNFATESFATILSEARKYRLNLIVAHQYIAQLSDGKTHGSPVRDAIFGNVGTIIAYRVGAEDAESLEPEFNPVFDEIDLVNLAKYNIYLKLMINGVASTPFSATTLPPISDKTDNEEKVVKVSRERYAVRRDIIEKKIAKWLSVEYFADVGKHATLEDEDEDEEVGPAAAPAKTEKPAAPQPKPEVQQPKPQKPAVQNKPQPKLQSSPVPAKPSTAPKQQPAKTKSGEQVWQDVVAIHEQKESANADELLKKLLSVVDNSDLKPQTIEPRKKEIVKTEAEQQEPPTSAEAKEIESEIEEKLSEITSLNEITDEREKNDGIDKSSKTLRPGERIKFD